jgi:hypothetical protein
MDVMDVLADPDEQEQARSLGLLEEVTKIKNKTCSDVNKKKLMPPPQMSKAGQRSRMFSKQVPIVTRRTAGPSRSSSTVTSSAANSSFSQPSNTSTPRTANWVSYT